MTLEELQDSVENNSTPPEELSEPLRALWFDRKGDWEQAHEVAQSSRTREAAWVHAYLHRKEGDLGNARYWYTRAGRPESKAELNEEWRQIAAELLRGV